MSYHEFENVLERLVYIFKFSNLWQDMIWNLAELVSFSFFILSYTLFFLENNI